MEGKKAQPRAILVFGAPCSGKTTFCEKFSKQFSAPYYNFNDLRDKEGFSREKLLLILGLIAKTGQNIIIEGELDTLENRKEIRKLLQDAGYNPALVWIQTDINTIKARLKSRFKSATKAKTEYDKRVKDLEAPTDEEYHIVLSGKHTFETQLSHVLSQLA